MYELIQAAGSTYYIDCPAKIGLCKLSENEVCLIDSGGDKDAGRKIRQILDANAWKLKSIYLTHSHADHMGGAAYLQKQTGCSVYASGAELAFTQYPELEALSLFGAFPPKILRHKFLLAAACDAKPLTQDVLPDGFACIPLPGHCNDMIGLRTKDDVVFLGDCLASEQTLKKYRIVFAYDIEKYLQTLQTVKTLTAKTFVPAHAPVCTEITALAQINIDETLFLRDKLLALCKEPILFENLLKHLFDEFGLMMNMDQYVLVGSTVRSYLAWLYDSNCMDIVIEDNQILWKAK